MMRKICATRTLLGALCVVGVLACYTVVQRAREAYFWMSRGKNSKFGKLAEPIVIPLRRVGVLKHARPDTYFYVGDVRIGDPPQSFDIIFNTANSKLWVPHVDCKSVACVEHRRYSPAASKTAIDADKFGRPRNPGSQFVDDPRKRMGITVTYNETDLGAGLTSLVYMRDRVCLGTDARTEICVDQGFMAAVSQEDQPFRDTPADGIMGLSFNDNTSDVPFSSFFRRVLEDSENVEPHFSMFFGQEAGELRLGGHDESVFEGPLKWLLRAADWQGDFWHFNVRQVLLGSTVVDDCSRGCRVMVASGQSRIGTPHHVYDRLIGLFEATKKAGGDCSSAPLRFEIDKNQAMEFGPKEYVSSEVECMPHVAPIGLEQVWGNTYFFGRIALQHYYMAFDWKHERIGYAPLSQHAMDRTKLKQQTDAGDDNRESSS